MYKVLALVAVSTLRVSAIAAQQLTDTVFHVIGLQEATKLAERNAPSAVQARGQIRSASSAVRLAKGQLLPSLNFSLGNVNQGGSRQDPQGRIVPYVAQPWSYSSGFSSSLNLFDGGRRLSDISARRADEHSADANETAQRFNIALQVKTQYAQILAARESEAAARAQLQQAQEQLKAATTRVMAGAATLSDSLRSVIQVGNARLALLTAQNTVTGASAALTRLVGTPFLVTANPADTLDLLRAPVDSTLLAQLALRGPAVLQAEAQLSSARASERSSKTGYFPSVDLRYNRSTNGNGYAYSYGIDGGPAQYSWSFNLSYPLFNNFTREDAILRSVVAEDNAQAGLRDAQLGAQQNIIQQIGALRTAEQQIQIQEASVTAAQEDLRVQQQRYTLGASTLLDLLTSQSTLDQARAALIQARQNYRLARAQIEAIIGRDL